MPIYWMQALVSTIWSKFNVLLTFWLSEVLQCYSAYAVVNFDSYRCDSCVNHILEDGRESSKLSAILEPVLIAGQSLEVSFLVYID
jgi:hypothetical protein